MENKSFDQGHQPHQPICMETRNHLPQRSPWWNIVIFPTLDPYVGFSLTLFKHQRSSNTKPYWNIIIGSTMVSCALKILSYLLIDLILMASYNIANQLNLYSKPHQNRSRLIYRKFPVRTRRPKHQANFSLDVSFGEHWDPEVIRFWVSEVLDGFICLLLAL